MLETTFPPTRPVSPDVAVHTARLFIRSALYAAMPERFGLSYVTAVVRAVSEGSIDPKNASTLAPCATALLEVLQRIEASGSRLPQEVFPAETATDLDLVAEAFPPAWDEEAVASRDVENMRIILQGELERPLRAAAAELRGGD